MTQRRLSESHTQFADSDFSGLSATGDAAPPAIPTFQAVPTGDRTHNTKRYSINVPVRTSTYEVYVQLPANDGGIRYSLPIPIATMEHPAGSTVRLSFNAPITDTEHHDHRYACQVTSCRATPPAKILTQGDAAQRQWLAQHYRGLHAPGLLSPDILQPAGLQSCSHCHKVFTQGGMSRHENLCEDSPEATAPNPPPNSSDPDPFTDVALEFLEDLAN